MPGLFIVVSLVLLGNTLVERPLESIFGLGFLATGVPAYLWWRRSPRTAA